MGDISRFSVLSNSFTLDLSTFFVSKSEHGREQGGEGEGIFVVHQNIKNLFSPEGVSPPALPRTRVVAVLRLRGGGWVGSGRAAFSTGQRIAERILSILITRWRYSIPTLAGGFQKRGA